MMAPAPEPARPETLRAPLSSRAAAAIGLLRDAQWLTCTRVLAWSGALLIEEVLLFVGVVLWSFGAFGATRPPVVSDFVSFYGAGSLALAGAPELAYSPTALSLAEQSATWIGHPYNYFFYPPPFLIPCIAFALLPYMPAYILFQVTTLVPFLIVVRRIARAKGHRWYLPVLAFPSVFWTMGLGQNSFLSAAIFGAGTLLIDEQPMVGGVLLGLLGFKPHFGLLVPVALAAGRRWSAFAGAAGSVSALLLGSFCLFGFQTWHDYLVSFASSGEVYSTGRIMLAGYVTPFGAARLIGLSVVSAYTIQIVIALTAAAIVATIWRREVSLPIRASSLVAGTLLSVPVALLYDLLLIMICIAWLVRAAREVGFLPWEKSTLALLYLVPLLSLFVGLAFHVPLGPLAPLAVLVLCVRRAGSALNPHNSRGSFALHASR